MVDNDEWPLVAQGLINRGICGVMPLSSAFEVEGGKILGGLFGVPKKRGHVQWNPNPAFNDGFQTHQRKLPKFGGDLCTAFSIGNAPT